MSPSLVFPYFRVDGANGYCRVKPDDPRTCQGKPVKYESPKGRSNQVYLPPGSRCRLDDGQEMLLITEGEKKALALDQAGFVSVGLVGVWGWKVAGNSGCCQSWKRCPGGAARSASSSIRTYGITRMF